MKYTRKAIIDYDMLDNDEPVLLGLSGGKDSMTLLIMLCLFLQRSKYKFPLAAGHVDLGFTTKEEEARLADFCQRWNVELFVEHTNINDVVFTYRKETNPCSLCAKMRRGALNSLAVRHGFKKIALAHHLDDAVETFFLNLSFEARAESFKPVTWLSRQELTVIRPLIYVREEYIKNYSEKHHLPVIPSCCPANGHTKRQEMKELVSSLSVIAPECREHIIHALKGLSDKGWQ